MKKDIIALCNLGKIQTNRLTKDIVWNSLFIGDYENRYDIDPHVVGEFADGYLDWLSEVFEEEIKAGGTNALFKVLDREVRNNKGGYSFYDYTHYMYCID